MAKLLRS